MTPMPHAIALIPADLARTRLGLRSRLHETLADASVLAHTLRRVAQVQDVRTIVLVHPAGQDPLALIDQANVGKPVVTFAVEGGLHDRHTPRWIAARKWAPASWRGGLGGATVYDELLPPGPLVRAMQAHDAPSALLVGADWCLVDPELCQAVLRQHLDHPEAMKLTFTQAPPGLCGVAVARDLLQQLDAHGAGFGNILGYNPRAPTADPIGKEANLPVPPAVRDSVRRYIYDTPRCVAMIRAIEHHAGGAGAAEVVAAANDVDDPFLPQQVTVELTPRRGASGMITPQHHVALNRPDLDVEQARRIFQQLDCEDAAVMLGGLGDALLHPQWVDMVTAARQAGVLGVGVETDLLCDRDELEKMLDLPLDVVSVRLNADTAATYQRVMGLDGFTQVIGNLEWLINTRNRRGTGLPWIVPRMIKTVETLPEMETFFDKWMVYLGHAVIEPAQSGCGLMPEQSPVPMAPPRRFPCRQLGRRLTIVSDGTAVLCDQDWLGRDPLGDTRIDPLIDIWQRAGEVKCKHKAGRFAELTLCGVCTQWHRP